MFKIQSLFILLLLFAVIGCGSARQDLQSLMTDQTEMRVYEVFGMDCPGCHGGLENLVNKIEGVVASQANWEEQYLKVVVNIGSNVSDESIFEAITQANFTPGERLE